LSLAWTGASTAGRIRSVWIHCWILLLCPKRHLLQTESGSLIRSLYGHAASIRPSPAINLEHRGLDRVRTRGAEGFARTASLSIVAANVHRLGRIYLDKDRRRLRAA